MFRSGARRYGAKVLESPRMAFKESLRGLDRKRHDKAIIRVRHIHREKVRLLLHSGDDQPLRKEWPIAAYEIRREEMPPE